MLAERTYRRPLVSLPLRDALALVLTDLSDRMPDDSALWELVADDSPVFPEAPGEAVPSWFTAPVNAPPIEVRGEA